MGLPDARRIREFRVMSQPIAVITGATAGIGRAAALTFAKEGFRIATLSRSAEALLALEKDLKAIGGSLVVALVGDISQRADVEGFAQQVKQVSKTVDVLIHNAGVYLPGMIHEEAEGAFETQMQTNVASVYYLTRALFHEVAAAKGHVFTMCSTASLMAYPNGGSYCISKHALYGLTRELREEYKTLGVRVTGVFPGATYTRSWEGAPFEPERLMPPEDIALAILSAYQVSDRTVIEEIRLRPQLGDLP